MQVPTQNMAFIFSPEKKNRLGYLWDARRGGRPSTSKWKISRREIKLPLPPLSFWQYRLSLSFEFSSLILSLSLSLSHSLSLSLKCIVRSQPYTNAPRYVGIRWVCQLRERRREMQHGHLTTTTSSSSSAKRASGDASPRPTPFFIFAAGFQT